MRIIGELPHPKYKITVFSMNNKTSVKIEDTLLEQIYKFRDGTEVSSVADVENFLSEDFMAKVDATFKSMYSAYVDQLESNAEDDLLEFEII